MSWLESKKPILFTLLLLILLNLVLTPLFLMAAAIFNYEFLLVVALVTNILLEVLIVLGCLTLAGVVTETLFFYVVRRSLFGNW